MRLNTGFDSTWCNTSSPSLLLVSRLNISVPLLSYNCMSAMSQSLERLYSPFTTIALIPPSDLPPVKWGIDWEHEPFVATQQCGWFSSASRSYSLEDLASHRDLGIRILDGISLTSTRQSI